MPALTTQSTLFARQTLQLNGFGDMTTKIPAKERILVAATALMWRNGYDAVSVDTICEMADVRKGSFYHAFPSKEALLNAILQRVWDHDRAEIERCYTDNGPPIDQLRNHIEWFGSSQRRLHAQFGFVPGNLNMAVAVNAPQTTLDNIAENTRQHMEILTRGLQAALATRTSSVTDVHWWSSVVSQLISGAVIQARLGNSLATFATFPETVLALMGLGNAPLPGGLVP